MGGENGKEIPWEGGDSLRQLDESITKLDAQILSTLEKLRWLLKDKWNLEWELDWLRNWERLVFSSLFRILIETWEIKENEKFENIWDIIERTKQLINDKKIKEREQVERIEQLEKEKNELLELQRKLTAWMEALLSIKFPWIDDIKWLVDNFWTNPEELKKEIELLLIRSKEWVNAELEERVRLLRLEIEEKERRIWELEESADEYRRAAYIDTLTWLNNRRAYNKKLDELFKSWQNFSICIFDLDKFKTINDTYWHDSWDLVLKKIGSVMREIFWKESAFRIWWEEFCIIFDWTEEELNKKMIEFKDRLTWPKLSSVTDDINSLLGWIEKNINDFFRRTDDKSDNISISNLINEIRYVLGNTIDLINPTWNIKDINNMIPKNLIIDKLNEIIKTLSKKPNTKNSIKSIEQIKNILWWERILLSDGKKSEILVTLSWWTTSKKEWDTIPILEKRADNASYVAKFEWRDRIITHSEWLYKESISIEEIEKRKIKDLKDYIRWNLDELYGRKKEKVIANDGNIIVVDDDDINHIGMPKFIHEIKENVEELYKILNLKGIELLSGIIETFNKIDEYWNTQNTKNILEKLLRLSTNGEISIQIIEELLDEIENP